MSKTTKDISSAFKEKTWGKEEDGVYIIDGFSFRGKRGIAVLKLYGPSSKKKENVIMIAKSKQSDSKYVTILAKHVIQPIMNDFLTNGVDDKPEKQLDSARGKDVNLLKCPQCEKTSYSVPGLKGHVTKMHKNDTNKRKRAGNQISGKEVEKQKIQINKHEQEDRVSQEANKVVDLLINDVFDNIDEKEEMIEEVTLDETCADLDDNDEKKYCNKCENCDFVVTASRRYIALQQLKNHREVCCKNKIKQSGGIKSSCGFCNFEDKDSVMMRRHTRDHHDIIIGSTSPPPKRKKKVTVDNAVNAESMDTENVDINDLSLKLDEMEVDTPDSKNMNEESNLKDEKSEKRKEKMKKRNNYPKLVGRKL